MEARQKMAGEKVQNIVGLILLFAILVGGILLARRNLRLGRGDRKGAFRVASYVFLIETMSSLIMQHHVPAMEELGTFFEGVAWNLFFTGLLWVVYIALEPYARRLWPNALITWSRLLAGRLRDPRIGRDILTGGLVGVVLFLLGDLKQLVPGWLGLGSPRPDQNSLAALDGMRETASQLLDLLSAPLILPVALLFLILLLRILLRRQWAAVGALVALMTTVDLLRSTNPGVDLVFGLVFWASIVFVLIRFGLLAMILTFFFANINWGFPQSLDFSTWYAGRALMPSLVAIALAVYGFHISRAGRPFFGESFLPE